MLNLGATNVAFTQNRITAANLRPAAAALRRSEPALAARLARLVARERLESGSGSSSTESESESGNGEGDGGGVD